MTCTVLLAVFTLGSCNGLAGNDEMDRYFQRSDTITLSAGDAKQVNAVTHTIHPWPRGVGDRRIVVDAAKASNGIKRYRRGSQPFDPLPAFGGNRPEVGHPPMGAGGATAAVVEAGGSVEVGTAVVNQGAGVR